jgi:diadenosine tetraphosphate (Ap4A) HIT family hydrolase
MSNSGTEDCPFCSLPPERIRERSNLACVIDDLHRVSVGHSLVIARRHVASFFDLTAEEAAALFDLLGQARQRLERSHQPAGFNIGVNVGTAAGQTIPHVHIHLIPRYCHDVEDPTGGVRNVMPGRGPYTR